jgi:hypothetical protein
MYRETLTMCACTAVGVSDDPYFASNPRTCPFDSPNFCSGVSAITDGAFEVFFLIAAIPWSKQASRAVSEVSWVHAINESESASPMQSVGKQQRTHGKTPRLRTPCANSIPRTPPTSSYYASAQNSAFVRDRPGAIIFPQHHGIIAVP